jgi:hypothetical protein
MPCSRSIPPLLYGEEAALHQLESRSKKLGFRSKELVAQAWEHDADHCKTDKRRGGSRVALEIAGEAPIVADPGERSLDQRLYDV